MNVPWTMTVTEVAAALGLSEDAFVKRRPELVAAHGFPAPLPGLARYSRAEMEAWVNRGLMAGNTNEEQEA